MGIHVKEVKRTSFIPQVSHLCHHVLSWKCESRTLDFIGQGESKRKAGVLIYHPLFLLSLFVIAVFLREGLTTNFCLPETHGFILLVLCYCFFFPSSSSLQKTLWIPGHIPPYPGLCPDKYEWNPRWGACPPVATLNLETLHLVSTFLMMLTPGPTAYKLGG